MNKYRHSQNSIFLIELLLNMLLFTILVVISLRFFTKTHFLTETTTELHYAVTHCSSVASIFESENNLGDMKDISAMYPYCKNMKDQLFIYYNHDFEECKKEDASYYILINEVTTSNPDQLSKAEICFYNFKDQLVYSITACHYTPLTASHKEGSKL